MAEKWRISLPLKFQAPKEKNIYYFLKVYVQNKKQGLETKSDWFIIEVEFGQNTSEI